MAIPWWKVRREVLRLGEQIRALPGDVVNFVLGTWRYDRTLAHQVERFEGELPPGRRMAILVIFPKDGLQPSHLRTLEYLRAKDYVPLVVSNLPLSDVERGQIRSNCWTWLERPNFGYDFGGYRDGMLAIAERLPDLDRLVLLNDSIWFPLPGGRDWLDDAEACDADFVGATSHFGAPRPEIEQFRTIKWTYAPNRRNFHYGSFALFFRSPILCNPGFLSFWRRLRLADKKRQTVRRGEIGLTQWVLSGGYSNAATLDITTLDQDLYALSSEELLQVARDLIIPELPRLRSVIRQVAATSEPKREDLINLILLAVARQGASYALSPFAIRYRGFPFLKKSPVWLNDQSAEITLGLLAAIDGAEDLVSEARRLREAKGLGKRLKTGAANGSDVAAMIGDRRPTVMIIDDRWPEPDRDSGSVDAINMVHAFLSLGYSVVFGVLPMFNQNPRYREELRRAGVHTISEADTPNLRAFLRRDAHQVDVFVLSRVSAGGQLFKTVRRRCPKAKIIFNTVDLHHIRELRAAELTGDQAAMRRANQTRERELELARKSDLSLVVSTAEKELLETENPGGRVSVLPLARAISSPGTPVDRRTGIGFLGGFSHAPNLDAVRYFLREVWPLIRRRDPNISFEIVGANLPDDALADVEGEVRYLGALETLDEWLDHLKVSVAPLRFGAGAKGKVASSLCAGLPCVISSVAAEGMGLRDGAGVLLADTPEAMADKLVEVCSDAAAWQRLSLAALDFAREHLSIEAYEHALKDALALAGAPN